MKNDIKHLKKRTWNLHSQIVRMSARINDHTDLAKCYTCGVVKPWKELQAGHRWHNKGDHVENHIHAQCVRCNQFLSGNLGEYTDNLIRDLGLKGYEDLKQRVQFAPIMTVSDYMELEKKLKVIRKKLLEDV